MNRRRKVEEGDDLQDTGLILSVRRPQNATEWAAWHACRDRARRNIRQRCGDADLIIAALGLDPDAEADLLTRLG